VVRYRLPRADDSTADDSTADDSTDDDSTVDDSTADDSTVDDSTADDSTGGFRGEFVGVLKMDACRDAGCGVYNYLNYFCLSFSEEV
jgi:hypothetical protein